MKATTLFFCGCMLIAAGCSKPEIEKNEKLPRWDLILQQGNVLSTSFTFARPETGDVVCRYQIIGEDSVREYPVSGNTVLFTSVQLHDYLIVVHGTNPVKKAVAQMTIPIPKNTHSMRLTQPTYVNPTKEERTVWSRVWYAADESEVAGVRVSIVVQ